MTYNYDKSSVASLNYAPMTYDDLSHASASILWRAEQKVSMHVSDLGAPLLKKQEVRSAAERLSTGALEGKDVSIFVRNSGLEGPKSGSFLDTIRNSAISYQVLLGRPAFQNFPNFIVVDDKSLLFWIPDGEQYYVAMNNQGHVAAQFMKNFFRRSKVGPVLEER